MIALVADGTRNSSAANFRTAVNGALSGTLILSNRNENKCIFCEKLKRSEQQIDEESPPQGKGGRYIRNGSFGSLVSVILNDTLPAEADDDAISRNADRDSVHVAV